MVKFGGKEENRSIKWDECLNWEINWCINRLKWKYKLKSAISSKLSEFLVHWYCIDNSATGKFWNHRESRDEDPKPGPTCTKECCLSTGRPHLLILSSSAHIVLICSYCPHYAHIVLILSSLCWYCPHAYNHHHQRQFHHHHHEVYRQAFVQQALCSPSRTSMMTSRRPDTTHVTDLHSWSSSSSSPSSPSSSSHILTISMLTVEDQMPHISY